MSKIKVAHRGYAAVGLHQPKDKLNVGSAMRAAGCYGAAFVAASGVRYQKSRTDVQKYYRHAPLHLVKDLWEIIPYDCVPVCVEVAYGATPLPDYHHPERAFYIFGPEDGSVPKEIQHRCRDVVDVPTTFCMNLAATVNVVLYDRLSKQLR